MNKSTIDSVDTKFDFLLVIGSSVDSVRNKFDFNWNIFS